MDDGGGLNRGVHAAALASLPRSTPRRLQRLLAGRDPADAWDEIERGGTSAAVADDDVRAAWSAHARDIDLDAMAAELEALDAWVTTESSPQHPPALAGDIDPAPIVFRRGRVPEAAASAVAIVGTRRCTPTGRSVAMELGSGLASAGVTVVSGLALGIDGAAHRGALTADGAPVVGVVGSGLDVVYPRGNRDLWDAVSEAGTLLTEAPLGAEPEGWRFPARNRLLAALADVVVVVESKRAGGSMHTVEEAIRRGVTVLAVPGSVRNPAAAGTNLLLSEGCAPACSTEDVLVALGLATEGASPPATSARDPDSYREPPSNTGGAGLEPLEQRLLDLLDDGPVSLDALVLRSGAPVPDALVAAESLERRGLLARDGSRVLRA
jgi:DNA processing protein